MWFIDGGGWLVGLGLTGCLRGLLVLAFLVACLLRVFTIVRVKVWGKLWVVEEDDDDDD